MLTEYFNPRSHEGSDDGCSFILDGLIISIHAPTKGATLPSHSQAMQSKFQSTLPRRERLKLYKIKLRKGISIHAPTKGATKVTDEEWEILKNFNPRSHEGSDLLTKIVNGVQILFQSTLPRRERQQYCTK